MLRCQGPDWILVSMHDPAGRRGIWYRETLKAPFEPGSLEVCAGREGDDEYIQLRVGETVTPEILERLRACLQVGAWMLDEHPIGEKS